MRYSIIQNRETRGPYTIGQLRSMWNSGAITGDTLYCEEGSDDWRTLSDLLHELEPPATVLPTPTAQFYDPTPRPKKKGIAIAGGCLLAVLGLIVLSVI